MAFLGYAMGIHAPGIQDFAQALAASHHLLLSHGWAVPRIREQSAGAQVGITLNLHDVVPASPSHADYQMARHLDGYFNRMFLDPIHGRHYPADMLSFFRRQYGAAMKVIEPGDLDSIATAIDFLGVNYYTRQVARDTSAKDNLPPTITTKDSEFTEMGWEVHPHSLFRLLNRLHFDYQPRCIYITENGAAFPDQVSADGKIHDERRLAYMKGHLQAAHQALQCGAPLAGYFAWSLMDNFEWSFGYTKRFGLYYVDYETQRRLAKDSAHWYKKVIAQNGFVPQA